MRSVISDLIHFHNIEQKNGEVSAEVVIDKNLPSFSGHFPGNPILPAVSIVDISLHLLRSAVIIKESVT